MYTLSQIAIKEKMAGIVNKWKDNKPEKFSPKWWRYRCDRSYYIKLRGMLKNSAPEVKEDENNNDILGIAKEIFGTPSQAPRNDTKKVHPEGEQKPLPTSKV